MDFLKSFKLPSSHREIGMGESMQTVRLSPLQGSEPKALIKVGDDVMLAAGTAVPADGATGYGTGCIFQHTDGGDGTSLYVNEGDRDSANFNAITVAA